MADRSSDTVVVAVARTPFGKFEGALHGVDAPHLGALAVDETLARAKVDPQQVDALYAALA